MRDRKKLEPPHPADSVFFKKFFFLAEVETCNLAPCANSFKISSIVGIGLQIDCLHKNQLVFVGKCACGAYWLTFAKTM